MKIKFKIENKMIEVYGYNKDAIESLITNINIESESTTPFEKINDFIINQIEKVKDFNFIDVDETIENLNNESTLYKVTIKIIETYNEEIKNIKKQIFDN